LQLYKFLKKHFWSISCFTGSTLMMSSYLRSHLMFESIFTLGLLLLFTSIIKIREEVEKHA